MRNLILFFILLSSLSVKAQLFNNEKLDSLLSYLDEKSQLMGSVAIYQDGRKVYTHSMGYKDVELRSKPDSYTMYRMGSISKTFTATIILQLMEEGKLDLKTNLNKFYPEIPNSSKITMKDLLNHQSGLFNFTDSPSYLEWSKNPLSKEELLEIFKKQENSFGAGEKHGYSNTNYVLLTFIAEDIEQKSFEKIMEQRIIKPLDLKRTDFGKNIKSKNNEAFSYYGLKKWELASETDWSVPLGAGSIFSSASNLSKFMDALFEEKLIDKNSLELMTTTEEGFGLGIFELPYRDKKVFGHTGGIDGFQSIAVYFPNEKTAFSLLLNGTKRDINEVLLGIMDIYFGYPYQIPVLEKVENAERFTGIYSSPNFPLAIEIFLKNEFLYGKATGQSAFMLERISENSFGFPAANLQIDFKPEENSLLLTQHGQSHELKKNEINPAE